MSWFTRFLTLLILISLLAACAPGPAAIVPGQVLQSKKPRTAAPEITSNDRKELSTGNSAFALDLYRALNTGDANLFYSPYSISLALAMTYAGANGQTARQMADTLHFTLPADRLHPAFNAFDQELLSHSETGGQGADGKGFRLNVVNDIWGQQGYEFRQEFLDLLSTHYGAGLRLMNFKADPEAARKAINDYIAEKTEERIKDLIPSGAIDPLTRLVLTNAIYFNAAWQHPFEKELTQDAPFTKLDGAQVNVPMMALSGAENFLYVVGDGYQAVSLPYENQQISMLLLIPDAGQYEAFASSLDAARLESILAEMQGTAVHVKMPKFKVEGEFSLKDVLPEMGMQDAFLPGQADFSGIDGTRDLYISEVIHKSFVNVDEAGTEAAAATAVIMEATSAMIDMIELTVDRPFLFLIRDEPTGSVLFLGQVTNPAP